MLHQQIMHKRAVLVPQAALDDQEALGDDVESLTEHLVVAVKLL